LRSAGQVEWAIEIARLTSNVVPDDTIAEIGPG
jgi:hypothetical protein